jgi:hypothetical protein
MVVIVFSLIASFTFESALDFHRLVEGLSGVVYRSFCVVAIPTLSVETTVSIVASYGIVCFLKKLVVVVGAFAISLPNRRCFTDLVFVDLVIHRVICI